eukprot:COSAG02_NODE_1576_length_11868_cov_82.967117_4_plen_39_part_00
MLPLLPRADPCSEFSVQARALSQTEIDTKVNVQNIFTV